MYATQCRDRTGLIQFPTNVDSHELITLIGTTLPDPFSSEYPRRTIPLRRASFSDGS